ncbi:YeeE/YedE thiosulfate transporter family protein [Caldanaerobacter sp.]|uniref:YeeE/YedE thiosulfate transporter family protein n=1 Tax=Caldanaerobacter sp. TaxID=2930036 RepID=UPI003C76B25E
MNNIKRWLKYQWPFWTSGVFIGVAEVLYYVNYKTFITFTTSMGQMSAVAENKWFRSSFFENAFSPDINWVFIGVVLGGILVAIMEKEFRFWVGYNSRALLLSFIGAFIFSFGTRIAGGCTTHHVLGGIASMNIASWVVALSMQASAFLGLFIYFKLGLSDYFKPQETRWYFEQEKALGLVRDYSLYENRKRYMELIRYLLYSFTLFFFITIILAGFFDRLPHGLKNIGMLNILKLIIIGILVGIGIGKTGFGNVCGILTPNVSIILSDSNKKEEQKRINYLTRIMFMGMFPFISILISVIMLNIAVIIGWSIYGIPLPASYEPRDYLSLSHIVGGILMGIGSIFMLGCEIRNYTRLGMGYLTAFSAIPGFILGYLPYVFFKKPIEKWAWSHPILKITSFPYISHDFKNQLFISILYTFFLFGLFVIFVIIGKKSIGLYFQDIYTESIEKIFLKNLLRGNLKKKS